MFSLRRGHKVAQRQSAGRLSGRSDDVTLKKRFHVEKKYEKGISWHGSGLWCAVEKNPGKKKTTAIDNVMYWLRLQNPCS